MWTLFTLSRCVKRGYVGPSMVPGSWDGAWGIFVFLNTFVFFSLARFGFSKKSDEKQRSNKVHPYLVLFIDLFVSLFILFIHLFYIPII